MRAVSLPDTNDVTTPDGVVTWDGRTGEATGVSITSEIQSHLPAQVSGAGGIVGTTGSVDWALGSDVTTTTETPWTSTTPEPGDSLTVDLGRDGVTSRVFTGMIDDTGGSASGGVNSSGITDYIRQLDKTVSMRAMCKIMPSPTTSGSTNPLNIDLHPTYFVDRVLRACGYFATPPRIGFCVMSAPLQGSAWPEIGALKYSGRGASWKDSPYWSTAPWGVGASQLRADYEPDLARWSSIDGRLSRPMEIVLCAGTTQRTSGRIYAEWPSGAKLSVAITSSRSVMVQVMFPSTQGEWQTSLSATTATLGQWRNATVRFTPTENSKMNIEIRTNNMGRASQKGVSIPYGVETQAMSNIRVDLPDNNIGGVQVGFPSNSVAFAAANHKPTAVLTPATPFESLTGSPAIPPTPAIELLKEWSEAECAAMWLDEDGVFQWRNRERFLSGEPVWSGSSLDNLLDYDWSHTADGARSSVTVKHKNVGVKRSRRSRIVVWQGSGQTMDPGDLMEDIITPDNDKAWIGVDASLDIFQAETSKRAFNRGDGSWAGYVAYDADGNEHGNTEYVGYTAATEYISTDTWKLTQTWDGHVPTGVDHIKLQTRDGGTALKPQWQGYDLPVFRAQCELSFEDVVQTAAVSRAPAWAAELVHPAGWWIQNTSQARALAFWLAQQTTKPLPVVDEIRIMPDARLQIGDKIRLTDSHKTGVSIVGVISKIQHRVANGYHEMVLRLVVTQITADRPTLAEYDAVFAGAQLSARDESWGTATLAQFDADPLKR